ncbi:DCC1-like thiol-disulfide oxidoreductase family protein [Streptomyces niveiscabiei]|uniref:thiol-disulfide oxidoreductase DCC family protein n=1 Tax=Streptomyces niveiscabiei TaxID=164115 RepID=UPI0029B28679|nr:DCC1-like thiol-disulfide oxidoreductase family protein [Streptomyces niveiscabiei]MDX3388191.1 DCC1-like thiol-disulfide oxidoreductase family protein [Streptomyces niveiscabiei]
MILAFDGDCGICQATIQWISTRAQPSVVARPWQLLDTQMTQPYVERLDREVLLFHDGEVSAGGADALMRVLKSSPKRRYRALATVACQPGTRVLARHVYGWVARNRYRMPGGTAACAVRPSSLNGGP